MEAMIPKLFIVTAEASIVLLLILLVVFIFSSKAKRKDIKATNELVRNYLESKQERLAAIKNLLSRTGFSGNTDSQAEKLYEEEKGLLKEFINLYLKRDTYRLLEYSETLEEVNDSFLKVNASVPKAAPEPVAEISATEENANATIMAREQAELNEAHLKELSELRLKNTELNEHLFEALETVTSLMSEHGKKTGQEVESNAQKILEAIIYLRDNRLGNDTDPSSLAPSSDDQPDQVDKPWSIDLADKDATLDDSPAVNLDINDELDTDLDAIAEEVIAEESIAEEAITEEIIAEETIAEESMAESTTEDEITSIDEEADPWAEALAEQADAAAQAETQTNTTSEPTSEPETEEDPWAAALAEQAATEAQKDTSASAVTEEEDDPWAAALAEQEQAEKK